MALRAGGGVLPDQMMIRAPEGMLHYGILARSMEEVRVPVEDLRELFSIKIVEV